jgi:hypothetical protein
VSGASANCVPQGDDRSVKTADERPCKSIEPPVVIEDLHATIYHTLGISPRLAYVVERRPFYVTRDGVGKPITALLQNA